ncbi:MAG: radical SAM/SPASM domain-containing protein [Thermodesulfobacteriota bacterium]
MGTDSSTTSGELLALPVFLKQIAPSLAAEEINRFKLKLLFALQLATEKKIPPFFLPDMLVNCTTLSPLPCFFGRTDAFDLPTEQERLNRLLVEHRLFFVKPAVTPLDQDGYRRLQQNFSSYVENELVSRRCVTRVILIGNRLSISHGRFQVPFVHYQWCRLATGFSLLLEIDERYEDEIAPEWRFRFAWAMNGCDYYHLTDLGDGAGSEEAARYPGIPFFEHLVDASIFFPSRGDAEKRARWLATLPHEILFDRSAGTRQIRTTQPQIIPAVRGDQIFFPRTLGLRLTYRCNSKCRHCYCYTVEDGDKKEELDFPVIRRLIDEARQCGLSGIGISGGEPFLLSELLFAVVEYGKKLGFNINIATNAFWAIREDKARSYLQRLRDLGFTPPLDSIVASGGQFHMEHIDRAGTKNLIKSYNEIFAAPLRRLDFEYVKGQEHILRDYVDYLRDAGITQDKYNLVERTMFQSIGHSRSLDPATIDKRPAGVFASLCQWVKDLIVEPTGDIYPCCGFNRYNKGIVIGNIFTDSLPDVVAAAQKNPVMQMLATTPFSVLHAILAKAGFALPAVADGPCDICELIFAKEEQVRYLTELHLSGELRQQLAPEAKCSL